MRQDLDRRMRNEIDVVAAAGERALEVPRIERLEEIQHVLPVKFVNHVFLPRAGRQTGSTTVRNRCKRLRENRAIMRKRGAPRVDPRSTRAGGGAV